MIKTLNPYSVSDTAKTAEIMSRYRPIAPKPEGSDEANSMAQKIRQSPYLRNVWPQMQARPTRTRKRGRGPISSSSFKRQRTGHVFGLATPSHLTSAAKTLSLQGFAHGPPPQLQVQVQNLTALTCGLESAASTTTHSSIVTLPLLPCTPAVPVIANQAAATTTSEIGFGGEKMIDLNTVAEAPEETDLLQQLQRPATTNVVVPRPIRPVASTIKIGCINEELNPVPALMAPKSPKEVEEEMESEELPAVISDSRNKVRMANSAYKEMVGQPECSWLDSAIFGEKRFGGAASCRRISGQVLLHFLGPRVPTVSTNGFSCWVRIEWGNDENKSSVNAFCDVVRLYCEAKDYLFTWRFHTQAREGSQFSSNV